MSSREPTPISSPWMRLIILVFSALLSVACAQIPQTAVPNTATPSGPSTASESSTPNHLDVSQWETYRDPSVSFTLRYPPGWLALEGGIDYAGIYKFGSLKLLVFSTAPSGSQDGPVLSISETYRRFRDAYIQDAKVKQLYLVAFTAEIIRYQLSGDNGIVTGVEGPGTLALWQAKCGLSTGKCNFALFDELNQHQADGVFAAVLGSFRLIAD